MATSTATKKQPVKKIRVGSVQIDIWENKDENGRDYLTAGLVRSYKDKTGEWKESSSYMAADLDKAEIAIQEARKYMHAEYWAEKKKTQPTE